MHTSDHAKFLENRSHQVWSQVFEFKTVPSEANPGGTQTRRI